MSMKPSESNSEWLTRKRLIDPKFKAAGWKIVPFTLGKPLTTQNGCAIEEFETANGPADYALCADGRIVGVVEAKKLTLGRSHAVQSGIARDSQTARLTTGAMGFSTKRIMVITFFLFQRQLRTVAEGAK